MYSIQTGTSVSLKVLNESSPLEVAKYATALGIAEESVFAWWVPYTLRKRDRIIAAINTIL